MPKVLGYLEFEIIIRKNKNTFILITEYHH